MKVVIDSSVWIEYFIGSSKGAKAQSHMKGNTVIVPSLVLYEVYKKIKKSLGEEKALLACAQLQKNDVVALDAEIMLKAADISLERDLGMADATVYSVALAKNAKLITADNDFRSLPQVVVI